jgi:hypothetical protein
MHARKGEYLLAGNILACLEAKTHFLIELHEIDPDLTNAFQQAGRFSAMSAAAVATVAEHRMVAYLLTQPEQPANTASARAIAQAASALLDAGGLAVKVETAGKAFEAAKWRELLAIEEAGPLWELFVAAVIKAPNGALFTCGMHNLGLKDALVRDLPPADAMQLLREFTYFGVVEQPTLAVGHTFSLAADAPVYSLAEVAQQPYEAYPDFVNPYGMWELLAKQSESTVENKSFSKN